MSQKEGRLKEGHLTRRSMSNISNQYSLPWIQKQGLSNQDLYIYKKETLQKKEMITKS